MGHASRKRREGYSRSLSCRHFVRAAADEPLPAFVRCKRIMIKSKTRLLALFFVSLFLLAACSEEKGDQIKREVSEEAGDIVNAVAPADAKRPAPTAPPALTSPQETITAVEVAGGLLQLPISAAQETIDKWIGTLRGNLIVDDSDILVENLVKLKAELAKSPIDKRRVSEVLEILARETLQAGDDADNSAVTALGNVLVEAADALD